MHTQPEPCSWHHGRPKCDPTTGVVHQTRGSGQLIRQHPSASPGMSSSPYLDGLWDGRQVALQLAFCRVLLPELVQNSRQQFLCSSHLTFSLYVSLKSKWCIYTIVLTWVQAQKNSYFNLSEGSYFLIVVNLSITVHVFPMPMLKSLSFNEIFLPRCIW